MAHYVVKPHALEAIAGCNHAKTYNELALKDVTESRTRSFDKALSAVFDNINARVCDLNCSEEWLSGVVRGFYLQENFLCKREYLSAIQEDVALIKRLLVYMKRNDMAIIDKNVKVEITQPFFIRWCGKLEYTDAIMQMHFRVCNIFNSACK